MTNKYKMPLAPFVGVNHHGQSILFGGALLENEKVETFEWLFENFLKCMFTKYPKAIITDQDKAMGNAIKKVFPNTRHRFCDWHIKKHESEHLRPFVTRYSDFQESYKDWVNSDTIEEFESKWEVIRIKYNLENNCWISQMYSQRIHWAKAFLKDIFLAGMTTSGQSESINSFFDGFVSSSTMLNEFVIQYDKAVKSRRAAEEDEDFKTMNSRAVLSSVHLIEAKADDLTIQEKPIAFENSSQGYYVGLSEINMTPQISVRDPLGPTNTKSRPKNTSRIKSSLEMPKNEHVLTVRDWVIMPLVVQKERWMDRYKKNSDEWLLFSGMLWEEVLWKKYVLTFCFVFWNMLLE
uniref:MULE transposase domain-containing protein n=1 Tax=Lactuca sativa TaxID=4236 RepID=A0A9R1W885_LACSA|nr:hypothetical protein LSAT_V11C200053570 [Lactuca sativa]